MTWKAKEDFTDNFGHNILWLLDVSLNLFSSQVKRKVIKINKYGIYDLPHKFPNDSSLIIWWY